MSILSDWRRNRQRARSRTRMNRRARKMIMIKSLEFPKDTRASRRRRPELRDGKGKEACGRVARAHGAVATTCAFGAVPLVPRALSCLISPLRAFRAQSLCKHYCLLLQSHLPSPPPPLLSPASQPACIQSKRFRPAARRASKSSSSTARPSPFSHAPFPLTHAHAQA
jgi:hypothetical protein